MSTITLTLETPQAVTAALATAPVIVLDLVAAGPPGPSGGTAEEFAALAAQADAATAAADAATAAADAATAAAAGATADAAAAQATADAAAAAAAAAQVTADNAEANATTANTNADDAYTIAQNHAARTDNPHAVTAAQVGASAIGHGHAISDVASLQAALDAKAAASHTHATSEVTGLDAALAAKAAASHSHAISDVTGLQTTLDSKSNAGHFHSISGVTGLQTALDGKAATSHTHTASEISDSTAAGRTLLTAADAAAQRTALALGDAAQKNTGTTAGTVAAGNDSRFTDSRTPTAHASTHQHGGADEVATATPAANAIPKAGAGSSIDRFWIPPAFQEISTGRFRCYYTYRTYVLNGREEWVGENVGTGATTTYTSHAAGRPFAGMRASTGTTSTGMSMAKVRNHNTNSDANWGHRASITGTSFEWRGGINLPVLSSGTEEFVCDLGFSANNRSFRFGLRVGTDGVARAFGFYSATTYESASGVALSADTLYDVRIVVVVGGDVTVFVGGSQLTLSITGWSPGAGEGLMPYVLIQKSAGSTSREILFYGVDVTVTLPSP